MFFYVFSFFTFFYVFKCFFIIIWTFYIYVETESVHEDRYKSRRYSFDGGHGMQVQMDLLAFPFYRFDFQDSW